MSVRESGRALYRLSRASSMLLCIAASAALQASPAAAETDVAMVDYDLGEEPALPLAAAPAVAVLDEPSPVLASASLIEAAALQEEFGDTEDFVIVDEQAELSFGQHVRAIRTEMIAAVGYMTAVNLAKYIDRGNLDSFSFHDEGLFGKDTRVLGVDKLVHAHNTYVLAELIGARIRQKTGTTRGTAMSGALLASGLMLYSEVYDGFKAGFGLYDLAFNSLGAGFSVLRSTTPGLEDKVDFRVLLMPNRNVYSPTGKEHYRQLRYLFAVELAGFEQLERSPLRFVELHAGYYGSGFTSREQERGEPLERRLFAGVGLNLNELLFKRKPQGRWSTTASQALDYWQPPYTYIHAH